MSRWVSPGSERRKRVEIMVMRKLNQAEAKRKQKSVWRGNGKMIQRVIAYGVSEGGKPVLAHRMRFIEAFADCFPDGEKFVMTVEKSTRNLRQNALYWVWVKIIERETGNDPRWIHHHNKDQFNRITVSHVKRGGEIEDEAFPGDTHDLSVDAFAEFMQRVQRGWAEQGVDLPSPNDEDVTPANPNT